MTDQDLLRSYLAEHDADCPCCGYNLRAVESGACPECGQNLDLGVTEGGPSGFGRRWGLLLLVFAWLLLAGAMNDYRAVRSIHRTLTGQWIRQLFVSAPMTAPVVVNEWSDARAFGEFETVLAETLEAVDVTGTPTDEASGETLPLPATATTPTPPTAPAAPLRVTVDRSSPADFDFTVTSPVIVTGPGATTITADRLALTTSPPSSGWRWSAVEWKQWAVAAGWSTLALIGLAGLVVLVLHRRRPVPRRLAIVVMAAAWLGFGGYFVYHGVRFAGELM